jgi:hypothetical protein
MDHSCPPVSAQADTSIEVSLRASAGLGVDAGSGIGVTMFSESVARGAENERS